MLRSHLRRLAKLISVTRTTVLLREMPNLPEFLATIVQGLLQTLDPRVYVIHHVIRDDQNTKQHNKAPPLLQRAKLAASASIRSLTRLLLRTEPFCRGRQALRLQCRRLARTLPYLSSRRTTRFLCSRTPRAPHPAQEKRGGREDRGAAQAQLLDLRNQPGTQGAGNAAECHRRRRGAGSRGIRPPPAPSRGPAARTHRPN